MDLSISDLMNMQQQLHRLHEKDWSPLEPEYGKNTILYMVEEIGEVISILKKRVTVPLWMTRRCALHFWRKCRTF